MSDKQHNDVVTRWVQLGVMFNATASSQPVDLERLLLDTARCASGNSRLSILAVTWLTHYGEFVAKHRLAHLICHELEVDYLATMGLILDLAREKGPNNAHRFNRAIDACKPAFDACPLLDIDRRNSFFVRLAEKNASALSLKWGRWLEDFDLKNDAIRPARWIIDHNPEMRWRADFKGDLRASILAELIHNPRAGDSESELARTCDATRSAIRGALRRLELAGWIIRQFHDNRFTARPTAFSATPSKTSRGKQRHSVN